jgi:hypothetical protein
LKFCQESRKKNEIKVTKHVQVKEKCKEKRKVKERNKKEVVSGEGRKNTNKRYSAVKCNVSSYQVIFFSPSIFL